MSCGKCCFCLGLAGVPAFWGADVGCKKGRWKYDLIPPSFAVLQLCALNASLPLAGCRVWTTS